MVDLISLVPKDELVMGNISPSAQFLSDTPKSIREDTLKVLRECSPGHENFIISSGCDIPPRSLWANIEAFFNAVEEYYAQG